MPIARLSIQPPPGNRLHNLWCNNGSWWFHYTVQWDGRKRRIRRSLGTRDVEPRRFVEAPPATPPENDRRAPRHRGIRGAIEQLQADPPPKPED